MNVKVSIIIAVFNGEKWVKKCLESCLNQTYPNIEIIIINDGSVDGTEALLDSYFKKNTEKIRITTTENSGIISSRKLGIKQSSGEFLFFLDIDDYITNNAIELLMEKQSENNFDCVVGQYSYDFGHKIRASERFHLVENNNLIIGSFLLQKLPYTLWPNIFRKKLFDTVSIRMDINVGEDFLIMSQIFSMKNIKVGVIDQNIFYYVRHSDSMTKTNNLQKTKENYLAYCGGIDNILSVIEINTIRYELYYNKFIFLYSSIFINSPYVEQLIIECKQFDKKIAKRALNALSVKRKFIIKTMLAIPYSSLVIKWGIAMIKKY